MELGPLNPQGPAMVELVRLAEHEEQLRARVDEVDRSARAASAEVAAAREALVELERQAGTDKVSTQARRKAVERLDRAERAAAERWPEKRAGAERAAADGRHALQLHAAEHLDALVAELEQNGREPADGVDHAAQAFLRAVERRAEAERLMISILALARRMGPATSPAHGAMRPSPQ